MSKIEKETMCKIVRKNALKDIWDEYSGMVKNPGFICKKCGRVASRKKNLCKPQAIE